MKKVNITNIIKLLLPLWANWVAMDSDGQWWCYEDKPTLSVSNIQWLHASARRELFAYSGDTENWKDSLQKVE